MSEPATAAAPAPLNQRAATVVNSVIRVATQLGVQDVVDRLTAEAQLWTRAETTIVIAGEANRGKTSLLNSLLDRPLLPTGPSSVTTSYLVVREGEPGALVHLDGVAEPQAVALDDVGEWTTAPQERGVRAVEVHLHHPALEGGVVYVDTPGVGGLDAGLGRLTLAALSHADALVLVLDPSSPISSSELAFVAAATERLDTVVAVLTKVDSFRGWRDVAGDDRETIARELPHLATIPIVPVSNRLKTVADELAEAGSPDDGLVAESGLPYLRIELDAIAGARTTVRIRNILRLSGVALEAVSAKANASLSATATPSAAQDAAARDQAAIEQLREAAERAQVMITDGFAAMRESTGVEMNRMLRDLSGRLERSGERDAEVMWQTLEDELRAVDAALAQLITQQTAAIADSAGELVGTSIGLPPIASVTDIDLPPPETDPSGADVSLRLRLATTVTTSSMSSLFITNYLQSGRALAAAVTGANLLLNATLNALSIRNTKKTQALQAVRKQLQPALDQVRTDAGPAMRQRMLTAQRTVEAALKSHVRARTKELQASIAEATQLSRSDAAARQKAATALQEKLKEINALSSSVAALAREAASARRA